MIIPISNSHGYFEVLIDSDDFVKLQGRKIQVACIRKETITRKAYFRAYITIKQKKYFLSRLILGITDKNIFVDHINRNSLDNRKENLRLTSLSKNQRNRNARKTSSSKYKGVYWNREKSKWTAQIRYNKIYHLGHFSSEIEAAEAYNKKCLEIFNDVSLLNKI